MEMGERANWTPSYTKEKHIRETESKSHKQDFEVLTYWIRSPYLMELVLVAIGRGETIIIASV